MSYQLSVYILLPETKVLAAVRFLSFAKERLGEVKLVQLLH